MQAKLVHNYVIVGDRNANPGSLTMNMEPVKLSDGMEIAIKSKAHREVFGKEPCNEHSNSPLEKYCNLEIKSNKRE